MKNEKIGIIMKKDSIRDNIIIALQKKGYRVYVIPETPDMFDIMQKMELGLILLGEAVMDSFLGYIEKIKSIKALSRLEILVILHKSMQQSDMVNILKKGATDIVYIKNNNVSPVLAVVDKFLEATKAEFKAEYMKINETNVIKIKGELDITNSFHFKNKFNELFFSGEKNFVIDISEMEYLESVGLGTFIYMHKIITDAKGKITFIIKSKKIMKLLEMVKLNKYFEIFENIEDVITIPEKQKKMKVVVIDDARFMRTLIRSILEKEGFEVFEFANPKEALKDIDTINPDIILVDYEMPEMNGIEFIEKFKPAEKEIPVIMLTTVSDINLALTAIRMGASDFLNKPFESAELVHIIQKIVRENRLKKENEQLLIELKRREKELEKKNSELNAINKNMAEELELASEIQRRLLPQKLPEIDGFKFYVKYIPSQDIGGDFYDFLNMSNEKLGVAFADVSGHGIPAALLSTMFKVFLTTYAKDILSPAEAMEMINEIVIDNFPEGKFISTFYLIINSNTKTIKYCKASQEPAILIKIDGKLEEMLTNGQVLGLFSGKDFPELVDFQEKEISLKIGEKIFLYTDGIIEAKNKKEEFYGINRLNKILSENREMSANNIVEKVYEDLLDFLEGLPISDDLTLMVIERVKGENE